jgi:dTDP-glucose 4,6-dehydratase
MNTSTLLKDRFAEIRKDCLFASAHQPDVRNKLGLRRIAVTGGTGFLGTWIAETIAALNDEYDLGISLDLYARNIGEWEKKYTHLSNRLDVRLYSQDVRSPFQFQSNTHFVIHAAGVPNNRVHASEPLRVIETTVAGVKNVLDAAYQQDDLVRFINVSSGLVSGVPNQPGPLAETNFYPIPSGQLHLVYLDAKRSAESIAAAYRSQYRLPVSTVRPFTFVGPYQELDRPWAINSFMGDVLRGQDIRIHGDGTVRRSYLYGSDAAWWILVALIKGIDAGVYNLGSGTPISHIQLAELLCKKITPPPGIVINTTPSNHSHQDDLFPSLTHTENSLDVKETCPLEHAINKTLRWFLSE